MDNSPVVKLNKTELVPSSQINESDSHIFKNESHIFDKINSQNDLSAGSLKVRSH